MSDFSDNVIYPVCLVIACVVRYNLYSGIYLLGFLLFVLINKSRGLLVFYAFAMIFTGCFSLSHVVYTIFGKLNPNAFVKCESWSYYLFQIGIHKIDQMSFNDIRLISPDPAMLIISIMFFVRRMKMPDKDSNERYSLVASVMKCNRSLMSRARVWSYWMLQYVKVFMNMLLHCFCGLIHPSVISITYYIVFIVFSIQWSLGSNIESCHLLASKVFTLSYASMHMILLYSLQIDIVRNYTEEYSSAYRMLGLPHMFNLTCNNESYMGILKSASYFVHPILLFCLYYFHTYDVTHLFNKDVVLSLMSISNLINLRSQKSFHLVDSNMSSVQPLFSDDSIVEKPFLSSLTDLIIRTSYVLTYIAMLAFSITYISWLGLVWIAFAAVLWIAKDSRVACLYASPVILVYAIMVIFIIYAYNVDYAIVDQIQAYTYLYKLQTIDHLRREPQLFYLLLITFYLVIFCLNLKLFVMEFVHQDKPKDKKFKENGFYEEIMSFIKYITESIWIVLCCVNLLLCSIQDRSSVIYIVYLLFTLYFGLLFMIHLNLWARQLKAFWFVIVTYSFVVIFLHYIFQLIHINDNRSWIKFDLIGFRKFTEQFFSDVLQSYVMLLMVVTIQLRFYTDTIVNMILYRVSDDFDSLTFKSSTKSSREGGMRSIFEKLMPVNDKRDLVEQYSSTGFDDVRNVFHKLYDFMVIACNDIRYYVMLVVEIHFIKLLIILVICLVTLETNLFNFIVLIMLLMIMYSESSRKIIITLFYLIFMTKIFLLSVLQNSIEKFTKEFSNCNSTENPNTLIYFKTGHWLVFLGLGDFQNIRSDNKILIVCIVSCCVWHILRYYTNRNSTRRNTRSTVFIFSDFSVSEFNDSTSSVFKYLFNFTYYKIGLEICYMSLILNAAMRADVFSFVYLILLMIFLLMSRRLLSKVWIFYLILLTFFIIFQFIISLDFSLVFCKEPFLTLENIYLCRWFFISHRKVQYDPMVIRGDLLQLMFAIYQLNVFRIERNVLNFQGGRNQPLLYDDLPDKNAHDFICQKTSYLDFLRSALYYWSYWVVVSCLFLSGAVLMNFTAPFYMILAVIYFWSGPFMMSKKKRQLIHAIDFLLIFILILIFIRRVVQFNYCVINRSRDDRYINQCNLVYFFTAVCMRKEYNYNETLLDGFESCPASKEENLIYDIVCFSLILLQRRVFCSKNFSIVSLDLKVTAEFASRGAILIERKYLFLLEVQQEQDIITFEKVNKSISLIEQRHFNYGRPLPNEHYMVLRSGDYFLFKDIQNAGKFDDRVTDSSSSSKRSVETKFIDFNVFKLQKTKSQFGSTSSMDSTISLNKNMHSNFNVHNKHGEMPEKNARSNSNIRSKHNDMLSQAYNTKAPKPGKKMKSNRKIRGRPEKRLSDSSNSDSPIYYAPNYTDENVITSHPQGRGPNKQVRAIQSDSQSFVTPPPISKKQHRQSLSLMSQGTASTKIAKKQRTASIDEHNDLFFQLFQHGYLSTLERSDTNLIIFPELSTGPPGSATLETLERESAAFILPQQAAQISVTARQKTNQERPKKLSIIHSTQEEKKMSFNFKGRMSGNFLSTIHSKSTLEGSPRSKQITKRIDDMKTESVDSANMYNFKPTLSWNKATDAPMDQYLDAERSITAHKHESGLRLFRPSSIKHASTATNSRDTASIGLKTSSSETTKYTQGKHYMKMLIKFILKLIVMLTLKINSFTSDIRYVRAILSQEKMIIKKKLNAYKDKDIDGRHDSMFILSSRSGREVMEVSFILQFVRVESADNPYVDSKRVELVSISIITREQDFFETQSDFNPTIKQNRNFNNNLIIVSDEHLVESQHQQHHKLKASECYGRNNNMNKNQRQDFGSQYNSKKDNFIQNAPSIIRLLIAITDLMVIHSDILCYSVMILHFIRTCDIFTLIYPISLFLWVMLSIPRPSTLYWQFILIYTQILIFIKYIYKLGKHIYPDMVIFSVMNRADSSSIFYIEDTDEKLELFQLLVLFLHRDYLKSHGLWKDTELTSEEKPMTGHILFILKLPFKFLKKITSKRLSLKTDVYKYMFACEFMSFLILFFGYASFTFSDDSGIEFITKNKIPGQFISLLLVQFMFILFDRVLYLRKQIVGKLIFLYFQVIVLHFWLCIVLPQVVKRKFTGLTAPTLLYVFKCVYFALSAHQIKSGYPSRMLGNFLTRNYNYVNLFSFKAFLIVPFLYEIRNVMDWMCTPTSLSFYHWMEVEDVFTKVFSVKCWRRAELAYPTPRGIPYPTISKIFIGTLLMLVFVFCLWGPLTLGSLIGATLETNIPSQCRVSLEFDGTPPIYRFDAHPSDITLFNKSRLDDIINCFSENDKIKSILSNTIDVTILNLQESSISSWSIAPRTYDNLVSRLHQKKSLHIYGMIKCRREIDSSTVEYMETYKLSEAEKTSFLTLFRGESLGNSSSTDSSNSSDKKTPILEGLVPHFLLFKGNDLQVNKIADTSESLARIQIKFENSSGVWSIKDITKYKKCFTDIRSSSLPSIIIFNERNSGFFLVRMYNKYGILGIYAAYIFVANRIFRQLYFDISYIIQTVELPNVDRVLKLLNQIYLVRENKMFRLEEQLVAKLIFLYRSSETLIKYTRFNKQVLLKHLE